MLVRGVGFGITDRSEMFAGVSVCEVDLDRRSDKDVEWGGRASYAMRWSTACGLVSTGAFGVSDVWSKLSGDGTSSGISLADVVDVGIALSSFSVELFSSAQSSSLSGFSCLFAAEEGPVPALFI